VKDSDDSNTRSAIDPPGVRDAEGSGRRPSGNPLMESAPVIEPDPIEAVQRRRAVLVKSVRIGFIVVLLSVVLVRVFAAGVSNEPGEQILVRLWYLTFGLAMVMAGLFITIDLLTPTKKIATLVSIAVGLLLGLVSTAVFSLIIDLLSETYQIDQSFTSMLKILTGICMCYLGVTVVIQTQDDFRVVIPYVEFAKQLRGPRPLILDSSALIDARIVDAVQSGFFQAPLVVPRFVVGELQRLADSGDSVKRARGRRGLDVVSRLQRVTGLDVSIDSTKVPGVGVDQMLIELAIRTRGMIVTTDTGLLRVASIQGATALNLHELASALRPALSPGERVTLRLIKPGEQPEQAVGYLPDGTMVVAEDGYEFIGREAPLSVVSTLQTSAGRLVFARLARHEPDGFAESEPNDGHRDEASEPTVPDGTALIGTESNDTGAIDESVAPSSGDARGQIDPPTAKPAAKAEGESPAGSAHTRGPFPPKGSARPKNSLRNPRR
jgi:uncharacterized protein YacL